MGIQERKQREKERRRQQIISHKDYLKDTLGMALTYSAVA